MGYSFEMSQMGTSYKDKLLHRRTAGLGFLAYEVFDQTLTGSIQQKNACEYLTFWPCETELYNSNDVFYAPVTIVRGH